MLPPLCNIGRANIDDGASDTLGRCDHDVVVLRHLESIQRFARAWLVQYTRIDGVGDGIVDQFAEDETILTFIEELHGCCRDWEKDPDVGVIFNHL